MATVHQLGSAAAVLAGRAPSAYEVQSQSEHFICVFDFKVVHSLNGFSVCHSQPNVNQPVATAGSAWSPTNVSARRDSLAASARKESEGREGTVRKTAFWSTSLTWRLTCWTSPVILYKKQSRMITRSSPVGRLNVTEAFQEFAFRTPSPISNCPSPDPPLPPLFHEPQALISMLPYTICTPTPMHKHTRKTITGWPMEPQGA